MEEGQGLAELIPPLDRQMLRLTIGESACIIKYGLKGPWEINGKVYNQPMPANVGLSNIEIAEILTYVYNEFADTTTIISQHEIAKGLQNCDSADPLTE